MHFHIRYCTSRCSTCGRAHENPCGIRSHPRWPLPALSQTAPLRCPAGEPADPKEHSFILVWIRARSRPMALVETRAIGNLSFIPCPVSQEPRGAEPDSPEERSWIARATG